MTFSALSRRFAASPSVYSSDSGMTDNPDYMKDLDGYLVALGGVALSWNRLQEAMAILFAAILNPLPNQVSLAMWNSLVSDRSQRDLMKAAIQVRFSADEGDLRPQFPGFKHSFETVGSDLGWLMTEAIKLENDRNDALHSPLTLSLGQSVLRYVPSPVTGYQRAKNLRTKTDRNKTTLIAEFDYYALKAETLRGFALSAQSALLFPGPVPIWPVRPLLPTLSSSQGKG